MVVIQDFYRKYYGIFQSSLIYTLHHLIRERNVLLFSSNYDLSVKVNKINLIQLNTID